MRALLRQFRRAPGRIIASVFALALAVGAIGVLAIPTVSSGTLDDVVERDGLADIMIPTSPLEPTQIDRIARLDNVAAVEAEVSVALRTENGQLARLIGLDLPSNSMDRLHVVDGRLPSAAREVLVESDVAAIGEQIVANDTTFSVVGHGSTLWFSDSRVLYTDRETALTLAPGDGTNRLVITAVNDSIDELRSITDEVRSVLAADGDTFTEFPFYLPDGSTPIDQDIRQVSTLIGLLGIVAGLVALVLLASTTNTLITERTREVAVMRALGGRSRPLRRRLRRLAVGITLASLVVGLPLGIVISNVIARQVLNEFVGITPDVGIDWRVLVGSAIGMLIGARLVAARAARRVTKLPLAEALRDREGQPFGRRWSQRVMTRVPTGGLFGRLAARASLHRPARTVAVFAQIAAAVGAAFLIPSLATSVNSFNSATNAAWGWESNTIARDPGLPFEASLADGLDGVETGINVSGELDDWEIDVFGLTPETRMFDPMLRAGDWIEPGARQAVISAGFAARENVELGDRVDLELASGTVNYEIVGTSDDFGRAIYLDRAILAADLGNEGMANVVWSDRAEPGVELPVAARTSTTTELAEDDAAGRDAIVAIFGAIGLVVSGVAALAVISSMTVSLYERRHEFAAMQALGARRRRLRGLLFRELLPLGIAGIAAGLVVGGLGTRGIIGSFESSNAIDIGVVDATGAIPLIVAGTLIILLGLAALIVRSSARRSVAVVLRGAG